MYQYAYKVPETLTSNMAEPICIVRYSGWQLPLRNLTQYNFRVDTHFGKKPTMMALWMAKKDQDFKLCVASEHFNSHSSSILNCLHFWNSYSVFSLHKSLPISTRIIHQQISNYCKAISHVQFSCYKTVLLAETMQMFSQKEHSFRR